MSIRSAVAAKGLSAGRTAVRFDGGQPTRERAIWPTLYHYVAWKAVANQMEVGSYPGNSTDNQDIAVTFQPKWVIVEASTSTSVPDGSPGTVHRPDTMTGDVSINFNRAYPSTVFDNCIQALQTTGFQVGTDQVVNQVGKTDYWMAFSASAGAPATRRVISWAEVDPYP